MNFTAYKHSIIKERPSLSVKLFWIGVLIITITFLIYYIDNQTSPQNALSVITNLLFFIGIVPILFAYVYQFFDFEIVEISDKGYLELNEEEIIIDHQKLIRYEEITDFDVKLIAFYNQKINLAYRMPTERRSLGLSNGIKITTDSQKIILNFKLENSTHQRELEEVIKQLVINDKLKNIDAKKLIHLIPTRFKKSEHYKDYVIKQIVANRINCTEGLLLHGYNSDKEAKELRKKYCGQQRV